jgi:spermidine/putrescine transport system substrate-binding protein
MLDPELANDKTAYPDEADVADCEVFEDLSNYMAEYDRIWTEVKAH